MDVSQPFILNNFQLLGKVGFGAFGEVFKAREKVTGKFFAAKISIQQIFEDTEEEEEEDENEEKIKNCPNSKIRNLIREVNIISKLNHPSIVKFVGFSLTNFSGENKPVIITEFLSNGTLNDLIVQERRGIAPEKWNDTRKLIVLYGIAAAMSYLHSHKIIHRDLKPDNIMMDDEMYPKITDFGLSKITDSNQETVLMNSTAGIIGTVIYLPPESLLDYQYSEAGDVYAFSMIAYEIMTNKKPFARCTFFQILDNLVKGIRPQMDAIVPESYQNLINKCWESNASNRPTFDEIVEELRGNEAFITDTIDEVEFFNYIDYIDEYKSSFSSGKSILSIEEFMNKRKKKPSKPRAKSTRHSIFGNPSSNTEDNKNESNNTQNIKEEHNIEFYYMHYYAFIKKRKLSDVKNYMIFVKNSNNNDLKS